MFYCRKVNLTTHLLMKDRKKDHLDLAKSSRLSPDQVDSRFYYEPLLSGHPGDDTEDLEFLGKKIGYPLWISSMTGGTREAYRINSNLAKACNEFRLAMGLGSCRPLLESRDRIQDFDFRSIIGDDLPFYANLGIAQIENLLLHNKTEKITELINLLEVDGLIIHINPMQEWLQPEGDRIQYPPVETIQRLMEKMNIKLIVKEVGQGMGPGSLRQLLKLPLEAIEFGAFGGTNFAKLELMRADKKIRDVDFLEPFARIGHDAYDMLDMVNAIISESTEVACKSLIISGGIKDFLTGYYLVTKSTLPAVYGQASSFLNHARDSYETLQKFVGGQTEGYRLARTFLRIKQ